MPSEQPPERWDDESEQDAPFSHLGLQRRLARLREYFVFLGDDGDLYSWSDAELADRVGVTRAYIQQIMKGQADNLSMEKLVALSNAFSVSPLYFLSETAHRRINRQLDARRDRLRQEQLFGSRGKENRRAEPQGTGEE